MYLLSYSEISGYGSGNDNAYEQTRMLDLYSTDSNAEFRTSNTNYNLNFWWTRTPAVYNVTQFTSVNIAGNRQSPSATTAYGVAPAFRVGTN